MDFNDNMVRRTIVGDHHQHPSLRVHHLFSLHSTMAEQQNVPTFKLVLCGDGGTGKVRQRILPFVGRHILTSKPLRLFSRRPPSSSVI